MKNIILSILLMSFLIANVSAISIFLPSVEYGNNITQCNTQFESDGVYEIVNDLNFSSEFPAEDNGCLEISAYVPNIVINGNGHTIRFFGQSNTPFMHLGSNNLNLSINNLTVISDNTENGNLLLYSEVGGQTIYIKDINLVNMSYGLLVYPDEDLVLNAENINVVGQTGNGFFSESDLLANSSISNLTITMLEGWDFGFLAVNNGINNLTLRNITFLDYADRGKVEYKTSTPITVSGNFYLNEEDVSFYSNGINLMRDSSNFTKGQFENVPATITFTNLPNSNYYVFNNGIAISSWLYDPNTETLTFDVNGAGNYSYTSIEPYVRPPNPIYDTLDSSGAGLGKFIGYLSLPIAILLLLIGITIIVIQVSMGFGNIIKRISK